MELFAVRKQKQRQILWLKCTASCTATAVRIGRDGFTYDVSNRRMANKNREGAAKHSADHIYRIYFIRDVFLSLSLSLSLSVLSSPLTKRREFVRARFVLARPPLIDWDLTNHAAREQKEIGRSTPSVWCGRPRLQEIRPIFRLRKEGHAQIRLTTHIICIL